MSKPVETFAAKFTGKGLTSDRTRDRMIEVLRGKGVKNEQVLKVMAAVPRHAFVDEALEGRAYETDKALPIGHGQTISTPEIVAIMTELICEKGLPKKVLEIGTGCGYQTAVLAKLAKQVYTVERIAPLMDRARRTLRDLRYFNIIFKHADGYFGYPEAGPSDAIVMTAAATHVPDDLRAQLAVGGRMVMPVGNKTQKLYVIDREIDGFVQTIVHDVRFVPLVPGTI